MRKKNLLFVTGTRADFGKIEPLARIAADDGHAVSFFITGMHMQERFGLTKLEVRKFEQATCHEFINHRHGDPQDIILSKTVQGFSDWVHEEKPDLVVVHGDRVEALAAALVCSINYIPCAHVEGGEVSGTIDEVYRHCNSKLCKYHFVSSDTARKRLLSLGETPEQVYVIGSPEMDVHKNGQMVALEDVLAHYEIPFSDFSVVLFHPVTSEQETMGQQAQALFESLKKSGRQFVVIKPNNDPGSDDIMEHINDLPNDRFRTIPSMRFSYFSTLMKNAGSIIGNSSLGVREAPFLGIPSLNIGTRQTNRAVASSVTHAASHDDEQIRDFLENEWGKRYPPHMEYGDGNSSERFLSVLNEPAFWDTPHQKVFYDGNDR